MLKTFCLCLSYLVHGTEEILPYFSCCKGDIFVWKRGDKTLVNLSHYSWPYKTSRLQFGEESCNGASKSLAMSHSHTWKNRSLSSFFSFLFPLDKLCAFYWHNCDTCAETPVTWYRGQWIQHLLVSTNQAVINLDF